MNELTEADFLRDENARIHDLIEEMGAIASDLYAMRGEDEITADRCTRLIALAAAA